MTTPIQLINNGTTASSCAGLADDWESHPLLAGYDEEAALSKMPCATWESGFFVGEVFCAWAEWAGSWASTRPSQEHAAAQREQGAARQREQEEARQREQETARQREQEAVWQREQEAARHVCQCAGVGVGAAQARAAARGHRVDGDGECGELAHHRAPRYANGRVHHLRAGGTRRQHRLHEGAVLLV
jgi:hypothetical protein